jgi:hypothetical protein
MRVAWSTSYGASHRTQYCDLAKALADALMASYNASRTPSTATTIISATRDFTGPVDLLPDDTQQERHGQARHWPASQTRRSETSHLRHRRVRALSQRDA